MHHALKLALIVLAATALAACRHLYAGGAYEAAVGRSADDLVLKASAQVKGRAFGD